LVRRGGDGARLQGRDAPLAPLPRPQAPLRVARGPCPTARLSRASDQVGGAQVSRHYDVEMQDAVDGRLDPTTRRQLETHLAACASCRATYERLRWAKEALAVAGESDVPQELAARIRTVLDQEDRITDAPRRLPPRLRWRARWVTALAAAILVIAGVTLLTRHRPQRQDVITAVAEDFGRYRAGSRTLDLVTDDGERLRAFFAKAGLGFDARVLDL